jgi:hypothetical protein
VFGWLCSFALDESDYTVSASDVVDQLRPTHRHSCGWHFQLRLEEDLVEESVIRSLTDRLADTLNRIPKDKAYFISPRASL